MKTYYLIRHGQKTSHAGDPPLTREGQDQARKTAKYFVGKNISRIISSTYKRTLETSKIIDEILKVGIEKDDRLRERMNWGSIPEQSLEEFLKEWEYSDLNRNFKPKAGTSSFEAGNEALKLISELSAKTQNDNVLIVTHGGVIVDLLRNLFSDAQIEKQEPGAIMNKVAECSITILTDNKGVFELVELDSTGHLS